MSQLALTHTTHTAPSAHPHAVSKHTTHNTRKHQADILMVTDGEISPPSEELMAQLARAQEDLGLEIHGLLVSSRASDPMQRLCTHLHMFKSWTAVGAEAWQYQFLAIGVYQAAYCRA